MAAALYNMALRQASSIQSDIARLESEPPLSSSCVALQGQITASLSAFCRTVEDYESMARREMNDSKRDKAMSRVKKFREDEKEMRGSLAKAKNRDPANFSGGTGSSSGGPNGLLSSTSSSTSAYASSSARAPAANLESPFSLHARNSAAPGSSTSTGGPGWGSGSHYSQQMGSSQGGSSDPLAAYKMNASAQAMFGGTGGSGGFGGAGGGYSAREDHALREHSFIQNTEAQLDAFIAQGKEVWGNLTEQRDILKGTQRKLLDAANTMGLSRNVINMIERRSTQDNIILVVGAIFTLVCFYYIYRWFG
ncbi:unnamed protein product [Jaminaea pallidilutea]